MTRIDDHRVGALLRRRFGHEPKAVNARAWRRSTGVGAGPSHDESGAVLILALVFLVAVSVIIGGLTDWITNDLRNSTNFAETQSVTSSATNAVNLAIQSIRYAPLLYNVATTNQTQTLNASPPSACWNSATSQQFAMNIYCSSTWNPRVRIPRVVTISACPTSPRGPLPGPLRRPPAPAQPMLQAVVTFDDYPTGVSAPSLVQCVVYCGTGMTIDSWNWNAVAPVVTNVPGLSGPINGGTPIVITGTGFTSSSTVNFTNVNPLAQLASTHSRMSSRSSRAPASNCSPAAPQSRRTLRR